MVEVLGLESSTEIDFAESLLQEAERVWKETRQSYRDSIIEVGKLLQRFVIERLKLADGKSEAERVRKNLTRESAINEISERLKIKRRQAYDMIRVSIVVELFGDPGELTYSTLDEFTTLIQRKKFEVIRTRHKEKNGKLLPSQTEVWEIKESKNSINLQEVYNRAVKEKWDSKYTRNFINRNIIVNRRNSGKGMREGPIKKDKVEFDDKTPLLKVAIIANPKDLVDMVLDMIKVCPRSEEFKKLLLQRIK